MTNYNDLTPGEQQDVDKNIERDQPFNVQGIYKGNNCAFCYMIYYNCLCGHDED